MRKKAKALKINVNNEHQAFNDGKGRIRSKELISDEEFEPEQYTDLPDETFVDTNENYYDEQDLNETDSPVIELQQDPETMKPEPVEQKPEVQPTETQPEPKPTVTQEQPPAAQVTTTEPKETKPQTQTKPQEVKTTVVTPVVDTYEEVLNFEPTTRNERPHTTKAGTAIVRFAVPKAGQRATDIIAPGVQKRPVSKYQLENWEEYQAEQEARQRKIDTQQKEKEVDTQGLDGVPVKGPIIPQRRRITIKTASEERLNAIKRAELNKILQTDAYNKLDRDYVVNFYNKYGRLPKK